MRTPFKGLVALTQPLSFVAALVLTVARNRALERGLAMSRFISLLGVSAFLACATPGYAAPTVTYDFTGQVTEVENNGTQLFLNGMIPINASAAGSFTYDSGTTGTTVGNTSTAYFGAIKSMSLNIGNGLLVWNPGTLNALDPAIFVNDNHPVLNDLFSGRGGEYPVTDLTLPVGATLSTTSALGGGVLLGDSTRSAFTDQSLPVNFDLSKFDWHAFRLFAATSLNDLRPENGYLVIDMNSLTMRAAPEPTTLALLGLGLAGLAASHRRKQ